MKKTITVLILEDNPDDFFLLKDMIESSGEITTRIFHVDRLEKAIETAENHSTDVAIIDLQVPDSVGLDTFLSFHSRYPFIPSIIITGIRDVDLAVQAVQQGAQDYLYKGESSAGEIIRTIRHAMERQRLMTELKKALSEIKTLRGIVPICSVCNKIRDDKGYWNRLEAFIESHSDASFSHGMCPDCSDKTYGNEDWYIEMKKIRRINEGSDTQ